MTAANPTNVAFPDASTVPQLRLVIWRMGESSRARRNETRAGQHAIAIGVNLIDTDTAERYGDGGAEEVLGVALSERRR